MYEYKCLKCGEVSYSASHLIHLSDNLRKCSNCENDLLYGNLEILLTKLKENTTEIEKNKIILYICDLLNIAFENF